MVVSRQTDRQRCCSMGQKLTLSPQQWLRWREPQGPGTSTEIPAIQTSMSLSTGYSRTKKSLCCLILGFAGTKMLFSRCGRDSYAGRAGRGYDGPRQKESFRLPVGRRASRHFGIKGKQPGPGTAGAIRGGLREGVRGPCRRDPTEQPTAGRCNTPVL